MIHLTGVFLLPCFKDTEVRPNGKSNWPNVWMWALVCTCELAVGWRDDLPRLFPLCMLGEAAGRGTFLLYQQVAAHTNLCMCWCSGNFFSLCGPVEFLVSVDLWALRYSGLHLQDVELTVIMHVRWLAALKDSITPANESVILTSFPPLRLHAVQPLTVHFSWEPTFSKQTTLVKWNFVGTYEMMHNIQWLIYLIKSSISFYGVTTASAEQQKADIQYM